MILEAIVHTKHVSLVCVAVTFSVDGVELLTQAPFVLGSTILAVERTGSALHELRRLVQVIKQVLVVTELVKWMHASLTLESLREITKVVDQVLVILLQVLADFKQALALLFPEVD